jgi:rubrerythrin
MRVPLLERNPEVDAVTLANLVGIANAIEQEAVHRYDALARAFERRGEAATAAAFRSMLDEERAHVAAVGRWASSISQPVPAAEAFRWRLPPEIGSSWDQVAGSARLTPYRAFAIAADNELRAFALYSYIAANAEDPQVAAHAESLALEELRHAALVRRWRRQAWHRERRAAPEAPPAVTNAGELRALLDRLEAATAERHRAIAARLRAIGDDDSARMLERDAGTAPQPTAADAPEATLDDPVPLLVAAQEPLEALSETLEAVMSGLDGEAFDEAGRAQSRVIERLARIGMQIERRMVAGPALDAQASPKPGA